MVKSIIFCVIVVAIIAAFLFAWLFYQKAKYRERMYLLEKGEKLEDIIIYQEKNKIRFIFPWFKLGIISSVLSFAFLSIAFLIKYLENNLELFKGFLITFIIGLFFGIALLAIHFISKTSKGKHGE